MCRLWNSCELCIRLGGGAAAKPNGKFTELHKRRTRTRGAWRTAKCPRACRPFAASCARRHTAPPPRECASAAWPPLAAAHVTARASAHTCARRRPLMSERRTARAASALWLHLCAALRCAAAKRCARRAPVTSHRASPRTSPTSS